MKRSLYNYIKNIRKIIFFALFVTLLFSCNRIDQCIYRDDLGEGWLKGQNTILANLYKETKAQTQLFTYSDDSGQQYENHVLFNNYSKSNPFGVDYDQYTVLTKHCGSLAGKKKYLITADRGDGVNVEVYKLYKYNANKLVRNESLDLSVVTTDLTNDLYVNNTSGTEVEIYDLSGHKYLPSNSSIVTVDADERMNLFWNEATWVANKKQKVNLEVVGNVAFCGSSETKLIKVNAWTNDKRDGWKGASAISDTTNINLLKDGAPGLVSGGWVNTGIVVSSGAKVTVELPPPYDESDFIALAKNVIYSKKSGIILDEYYDSSGNKHQAKPYEIQINTDVNGDNVFVYTEDNSIQFQLYDKEGVEYDANDFEIDRFNRNQVERKPSNAGSKRCGRIVDWGESCGVTIQRQCKDQSGKALEIYKLNRTTNKLELVDQKDRDLMAYIDSIWLTEHQEVTDVFDGNSNTGDDNLRNMLASFYFKDPTSTSLPNFPGFSYLSPDKCYRSPFDDRQPQNGVEHEYWTLDRVAKRPRCLTGSNWSNPANGAGSTNSFLIDNNVSCTTVMQGELTEQRGWLFYIFDSRNYKFNKVNLCSPLSRRYYDVRNYDVINATTDSDRGLIFKGSGIGNNYISGADPGNISDKILYNERRYKWIGYPRWKYIAATRMNNISGAESRGSDETTRTVSGTAPLPGVYGNLENISDRLCDYEKESDNLNDCNCWRYGGMGMRYLISNNRLAKNLSDIMRYDPDWKVISGDSYSPHISGHTADYDYQKDLIQELSNHNSNNSQAKLLRETLISNSFFDSDSFDYNETVSYYKAPDGSIRQLKKPQPITKHHITMKDENGVNILINYTFSFDVPDDNAGTLYILPAALTSAWGERYSWFDKPIAPLDMRTAQGGYNMKVSVLASECNNPVFKYVVAVGENVSNELNNKPLAHTNDEIIRLKDEAQEYSFDLLQTLEMKIIEKDKNGIETHHTEYLESTTDVTDVAGVAHTNPYCERAIDGYYVSSGGLLKAFYTCDFSSLTEDDSLVYFRVQDLNLRSNQRGQECDDIDYGIQTSVDRAYEDNTGNFKVKFALAQDPPIDVGFVDEFLQYVKDLFTGEILKGIYQNYVQSADFQLILAAVLTLYIAVLGFIFLLGMAELKLAELSKRLMMFIIIIALLGENSWEFFDTYILQTALNLPGQITNNLYNALNVGGEIEHVESPYLLFEKIINMILSSSINYKVLGLLTSPMLIGWMYVYLIYKAFLDLIIAYGKSIMVYVFATIGLGLFLSISPVFIMFFLFERTKDMAKKWVGGIVSFVLQYILLSYFLIVFGSMFYFIMVGFFSYTVCYESVFTPDLTIGKVKITLGDLFNFWRVNGYVGSHASSTGELNQKINAAINIGPNLFSILAFSALVSIFDSMISKVTIIADSIAGGLGVAAGNLSRDMGKAMGDFAESASDTLQGGDVDRGDGSGKRTSFAKRALFYDKVRAPIKNAEADNKRDGMVRGGLDQVTTEALREVKAQGLKGEMAEQYINKKQQNFVAELVEDGALTSRESSKVLSSTRRSYNIRSAVLKNDGSVGGSVHQRGPAGRAMAASRIGKEVAKHNTERLASIANLGENPTDAQKKAINDNYDAKVQNILGAAIRGESKLGATIAGKGSLKENTDHKAAAQQVGQILKSASKNSKGEFRGPDDDGVKAIVRDFANKPGALTEQRRLIEGTREDIINKGISGKIAGAKTRLPGSVLPHVAHIGGQNATIGDVRGANYTQDHPIEESLAKRLQEYGDEDLKKTYAMDRYKQIDDMATKRAQFSNSSKSKDSLFSSNDVIQDKIDKQLQKESTYLSDDTEKDHFISKQRDILADQLGLSPAQKDQYENNYK